MAIVIHWVAVVIDEIIPVDVIDIPIVIIIHPRRPIQLCLIHPHIIVDISMGIIHTRINDGHYHVRTARENIPRLGRINVRINLPGRMIVTAALRVHLPDIFQRPLNRKIGVTRRPVLIEQVI